MDGEQETASQPPPAAPELDTPVDSDEEQQPTLKTGLTENLQDMGIDSAEDASCPEPMETGDDDTGPDDKLQSDDTSKPEETSQDSNQDDDTESKKEDETTSEEVTETKDETQESREGTSQEPTFIADPDEAGGDKPIQQQPPNQDLETERKNLEIVDSGDEKSSLKDLHKDDDATREETSSDKEDEPANEPKADKDIEIKEAHKTKDSNTEKTPVRRSRSQEDEEADEEEKGKTDEDQNERGAKKAKKDRDHDARDEHRQQRTLRPRIVKPDLSQMHTLEDFGYRFNEYGELRQIKNDLGFVFEVVPNDRSFNQRHYEALGEIITEHVFGLMESVCNLKKVYVPVDATEQDPRTFIFVSENILPVIQDEVPSNSDQKLLVLIHGSGVVRAGQWARRLIINNNLDQGTMIPYITRAKQEGYEVMLLNTNIHSDNGRMIKGSSSPESHGRYVWKHFISKWPGKVAIVAHSAGGYVTVEMAKQCQGFLEKVFAVGFTDSVHSLGYYTSRDVSDWFIEHSTNWVSSSKPLDTKLGSYGGDCPRVSAGTPKHEETSYYSIESIFKFFEEMERERARMIEDEDEEMTTEDVPEEEGPRSQEMSRGETGATGDNDEDNTEEAGSKKFPWWWCSWLSRNRNKVLVPGIFGGLLAATLWYVSTYNRGQGILNPLSRATTYLRGLGWWYFTNGGALIAPEDVTTDPSDVLPDLTKEGL